MLLRRQNDQGLPDFTNGLLDWHNQWMRELRRMELALDPFGIGKLFGKVANAWAANPDRLFAAWAALFAEVHLMQTNAWHGALGLKLPFTRTIEQDERFADPEWLRPPYSLIKELYVLYTHWLQDTLFETPSIDSGDRRRATFWVRQWLNAIAPSNFFLTNPVALRKFWESGGTSLGNGLRIMMEDMRVGDVQMVSPSAYTVGGNLATTPGSVIFRNALIELIHYTPTTQTVHAVPIVFVPPWINKYYILDLNERKSIVRHLVDRGFSVFMISWKNATADMAQTTFDDYMVNGVAKALEVAREASASPSVHAVGYCIGGTALAALMAWYSRDREHEVPVSSWTLLTSLVDFSRPGGIEVFIDEDTIDTLNEMMARQGYLDGREMGRSFRMLRPNSLIWHYVVHGYLYGEAPAPFDVLYWNTDVTRMPYAMHSFYLREFYVKNKLVEKDALHLAGRPIDLSRIEAPLYAVGCEEDHIAPWKATFYIAGKISGPVRYTLSSSGHILGIVNPPIKPPKRSHWTGNARDETPDEWRKAQSETKGSWWEDWLPWLARRCGEHVPAPNAFADYPAIAAAPGAYVREH